MFAHGQRSVQDADFRVALREIRIDMQQPAQIHAAGLDYRIGVLADGLCGRDIACLPRQILRHSRAGLSKFLLLDP